ncbi:MAG: pirin-like C-terminal cupin domain-containing protein [Bdellovibrionota bacterium]
MHGIQIWVALPTDQEECEPNFSHYPKENLPQFILAENLSGKLLIGSHGDTSSPVKTYSPTFFADINVENPVNNVVSIAQEEIGVFLLEGEASINDQELTTDDLLLVAKPEQIKIKASRGTRLIFIGGATFAEPRYIWWNFVSSRRERIREAAEHWQKQLFGKVAEEEDFIPLPNDPMP